MPTIKYLHNDMGVRTGEYLSSSKSWEGRKKMRECFKVEIIFEISHDKQVGRNAGIFNIRKLINVICHITGLKEENHVIISLEAEMDSTKFNNRF